MDAPTRQADPLVLVVMGVSGSGKTTIGELLAERLGWPFVEGDRYHSTASVAKMSRGEPLTDADRAGWLDRLAELIGEYLARGESAVLTCSALKADYRARLVAAAPDRIKFVYLHGSEDLIRRRMEARTDHFMKPGMLTSQFATLKPPTGPTTITVNTDAEPGGIVRRILDALAGDEPTPPPPM